MTTKILLVEDNEDLALTLAMWLQGKGYRVSTAQDSIGGLSTARREEPDIILLDLGLPGGGGLELLKRLRSLTNLPFIPVIVITAADASQRAAAAAAGAHAVLAKPVDNDELVRLIEDAVNGTPRDADA